MSQWPAAESVQEGPCARCRLGPDRVVAPPTVCADHVNCQSPVHRVAVRNGSLLAELCVPPTPCSLGRKDLRGRVVPLLLASIPTQTAATVHIRRARDRQECSSGSQRTTVPARPQRLADGSIQIRGAGEHTGCDEKRIREPPDGS